MPYFVVTILYSFPLKYISGYYSTSQNVLRDLLLGQVLDLGNTHLWFLLSLFIIFVVSYFVEGYWKTSIKVKLIVFYFIHVLSYYIKALPLAQTMKMLLWFYVGYSFEPKRKDLPMTVGMKRLVFSAVVFVSTLAAWHVLDVSILEYAVFEPVAALAGSYVVFIISALLSKTGIIEWRSFQLILNNSFGIYLYSDPINYVMLLAAFSILGSAVFTRSALSGLAILLRFFLTLSISILITESLKIIRKMINRKEIV